MAPKPSDSSSFSQMMTGLIQTMQVKIDAPRLKANAKVPTLHIKYQQNGKKYSNRYPLLGDRFVIGRSRSRSDIAILSDIVSSTHCVVEKDKDNPQQFIISDLKSTNGIYLGKKRYQSINLNHNDVVTLAPPELEDAVEIKFDNRPALWLFAIRYLAMIIILIMLLITGLIAQQWSQYQIKPIPYHVGGATVVYGNDNQTVLAPKVDTTHQELPKLGDFSPYLPQALIASEDSRYYWHFGVDPIGIARAIVVRRNQGIQQGASTITQQLARSIYPDVGRENNLARKWRELMVATKLEAFYSKDDILKTYLNRVYLGINLYGFEDASQFYFDKSAQDLDLAQSATLVAMLPAPNAFNPVQDLKTTIGLRNRVIERMLKLDMVNEEEASRARRSTINISPKAKQTLSGIIAPYFYSYIFTEMRNVLNDDLMQEGDFIVETSLDPAIQSLAETSLKDHLETNGKTNNFSQGAIVTLDSRNGEIVALVGGKDYKKSQFNRATQAQRQPGSTFKVFAYTSALENGISSNKTYTCSPFLWQGFQYRGCERSSGATTMTQALVLSENAIALRIAKETGLDNVITTAKKMGIKSPLNSVPGLILGQSEVNLLEITSAYTTFANQGIWSKGHGIRVIRDGRDCQSFNDIQSCREIYRFNQNQDEQKRVISKKVANNMHQMLNEAVTSGTGRNAFIGKGEAGKTGTTNRGVDLWFIGYIPQDNLVTGIWLGNDDNRPTNSSSSQASSLWGKYMNQVVN